MEIRHLNPAEADLRFHVAVDGSDSGLAVKGRLVGPRCVYASTVEVAYPLTDAPAGEPTQLTKRAIVPEPNLWEPACPFLYEATLELFGDCTCIDVIALTLGLRTIAISGGSFLLNGKRFEPKAAEIPHLKEPDLVQARRQFNTVVLPVSDKAWPLWHACDRIGLAVFGRVANESQSTQRHFANHPCLMAWLVDDHNLLATAGAALLSAHVPTGLQIRSERPSLNRPEADFVVVSGCASQSFQEWRMPIVDLTPSP
jgi:hypothetical protein